MAIEIVSFLIVFISSIVSEAVTFISLKLSIKLCIYMFSGPPRSFYRRIIVSYAVTRNFITLCEFFFSINERRKF